MHKSCTTAILSSCSENEPAFKQLRLNMARHLAFKGMENDNLKKQPGQPESSVEKGKKAIAAEKIAEGKNPADHTVKAEEEKDAEQWRNEG